MQTFLLLLALPFLIVLFIHLRAVSKFDRYARDAMKHVRNSWGADNDDEINPDAIPQIIHNFASKAGVPSSNPPLSVFFYQLCQMRMKPGDAWMNLRAEQAIGVQKLSFVWYAEQKKSIFVTMRVVDGYVDSCGFLNVRALGSLPLADMTGPGADEAELMRYLAELPWAPDAMLHNPNLRWHQLNDKTVEVEAGNGITVAKVRLYFDDAGDIVEMQADARGRAEGMEVVPRPWRGYYSDYREIEGEFAGKTGFRRIPTKVEIGWLLEDGYFSYWRGQIATYGLEHDQRRGISDAS
jgi:hypothetical protein